jgi:hypothetical protein
MKKTRLKDSLPLSVKSKSPITRRALKKYEETLHNYECYVLHLPYMRMQDYDEGTT